MTEQEWNELKERELDGALASLIRSVEKPKPSARFAARTMAAVRAADVPAGRVRLRHPMLAPTAWTLLFGCVAAALYRAALAQPAVANLFASFIALSVRTGLWLFHATREALALSGPFAAASRALTRAIVTTEGSVALLVVAALGAMSFSMLHKLLTMPAGSRPHLQSRY
jgi:hypothetical protein